MVSLRGVSARGTQGNTEPQLSALVDLFGFSTDIGFTGVNQATSRAPKGDEISAPYFVRADASKPVQMIPIARYVQANLGPIDNGRTTKFSGGRQTLYRFPPDEQLDDVPDDSVDNAIYTENQKTFPKIYSGTTSFNPTAAFGLYGNFNNYTDDAFNRQIDSETLEPTTPPVYYHNVRVYPAKGSGGAVIPNAYILGGRREGHDRQELRPPGPGHAAPERPTRGLARTRDRKRLDGAAVHERRSPAPSGTRTARAPASSAPR